MILCNGIPKSGTHALLKAVQLLGCVNARQDHVAYRSDMDRRVKKHIYIHRDPRDMLVSWVRFSCPAVTKGYLIGAIKDYGALGCSIAEAIERFDDWIGAPSVLTVEFQALTSDDREMRRIAKYLDVPFLDDAFDNLEGGTPTWTGKLSHWEDYWSAEVDDAWWEYFGTANQNKVASL